MLRRSDRHVHVKEQVNASIDQVLEGKSRLVTYQGF